MKQTGHNRKFPQSALERMSRTGRTALGRLGVSRCLSSPGLRCSVQLKHQSGAPDPLGSLFRLPHLPTVSFARSKQKADALQTFDVWAVRGAAAARCISSTRPAYLPYRLLGRLFAPAW
jgi:hypothetical protein